MTALSSSAHFLGFLLVSASSATACSASSTPVEEPACVSGLSPSCAAQYAPATYDTLFTKILRPNCATGNGTCHTSSGGRGGLVFEDVETSYARLTSVSADAPIVRAGDPSCSLLMKRLTSADPAFHMPPGPTSLRSGELCTIVQWIAAGAKR